MEWFDSPEYHHGMTLVREHTNEVWAATLKARKLSTGVFSADTAASALLYMGIATQALIELQQLCPSFIQPHDLHELRELISNTQLMLASWIPSYAVN